MEYHTLTGNAEVLRAAVRLGEFLLALAPVFNSKKMADEFGASHFSSSYICWTQQTEGLAALYEATADRRFAVLCEAISERMERRPGDHVHGYLCSLRGTLDLYRATHNPVLLKRVEEAWSDIIDSGDVLLTGGVPEAWSPKKLRTEGCAECDWLRLNLGLWRATADPRYIEMAERVYFNDFCQNQFATGDFGHAELTNLGVPATVAVKAWWCCTLHGMHAFSDIRRHVLIRSGSDVLYSFPLDAQVHDDDLELKAYSNLATSGTTKIIVSKAPPKQTLTVRRPSWADALTIHVNNVHRNSNQTIELVTGDHVEIKYGFTDRRLQAGSIGRLAKRSAFLVGPWLLGSSNLINVNYFNELHAANQIDPILGPPNNPDLSSPFAVPIAARSASYLPAEYPTQPARAELRAVAEQTAGSPARWEMAFATIPSGR